MDNRTTVPATLVLLRSRMPDLLPLLLISDFSERERERSGSITLYVSP